MSAITTTHYVPIERRELTNDNPLRWLILPVDTASPVDAMRIASHLARDTLGLRGATIWAAVKYIPDFAHMQEMRDEFDAVSARKKTIHRARTERLANSFNTFSASVLA